MKKIVYIFLAAFIGIFSLNHCNNTQNDDDRISTDLVENPNTASGEADFEKLPVFSFEKEEHDFGKVTQGVRVSYTFRFKNTGKSDLLISKAKASCGCTNLEYPKKPVAPGKEGAIRVTFDSSGRKGYQNKIITLIANTQPNTKVLKILAYVEVPSE